MNMGLFWAYPWPLVGQPEIWVARMRAKVSKLVSFRESLLQATACFREDLKCSFEFHG